MLTAFVYSLYMNSLSWKHTLKPQVEAITITLLNLNDYFSPHFFVQEFSCLG